VLSGNHGGGPKILTPRSKLLIALCSFLHLLCSLDNGRLLQGHVVEVAAATRPLLSESLPPLLSARALDLHEALRRLDPDALWQRRCIVPADAPPNLFCS
jgi:hypothetical protein